MPQWEILSSVWTIRLSLRTGQEGNKLRRRRYVIFTFSGLMRFLWDTALVMNSTNLSKRLIHKYTLLVYTYVSCQRKNNKPKIGCFEVKFVRHS